MVNDYSVLIKYKNKKLENVGETMYAFDDYTAMLSGELKSCLNDIEDSFKTILGEDVDLKSNETFMNIRRKILNAANAIYRLPDTMCYRNTPIKSVNAGDYIAQLLNN